MSRCNPYPQGISLISPIKLNQCQTLGAIAEIPNLTPHRLRHTFATNLLLWGMDSLHARTLTRHKSESSFKRYARRAMQAAAERAYYEAIAPSLSCLVK